MAHDAWRGERRIRVALDIGERSTRVTGLWMVDGPAVQRPTLDGTHVAQVIVGGVTVLLQPFDDPLVLRGIARPGEVGHSYSASEHATVHVDVPVPKGDPSGEITIRITDVSRFAERPIAATGFEAIASKRGAVRTVAEINTAQLVAHPDWATLNLGGSTPSSAEGSFEIYVDRAGKYRWRLRRPDGQIVADSGQGYADRSACEADLRWIRAHGVNAPVRSHDLPEHSSLPVPLSKRGTWTNLIEGILKLLSTLRTPPR
jgi:uncharacterized protein YegP (UPF0339 family)